MLDKEDAGLDCFFTRFKIILLFLFNHALKSSFMIKIKINNYLNSIVDKTAWEQLIDLYPYLVDCTTTSSSEVSRSLREALLQYCDLLHAPPNSHITTNGLSSSHC